MPSRGVQGCGGLKKNEWSTSQFASVNCPQQFLKKLSGLSPALVVKFLPKKIPLCDGCFRLEHNEGNKHLHLMYITVQDENI